MFFLCVCCEGGCAWKEERNQRSKWKYWNVTNNKLQGESVSLHHGGIIRLSSLSVCFLYLSRTSEHPCPENFGDTKDVRDAFQVAPRYLHSNGECTSCGYISYWETGIPARDCTSLIFIVGLESILQVKQRYPRDLKVECTKFMLGHSSKQWHRCQHLTLSSPKRTCAFFLKKCGIMSSPLLPLEVAFASWVPNWTVASSAGSARGEMWKFLIRIRCIVG